MTSIIGSNAAIRYLKAYQAHLDYWHQVNPAYQLAYVDKPEHGTYIQEYAAALPNSMIVARIKHPLDGGFHLKPTGANDTRYYVASPGDYHRDFGYLGRIENGILNVMNEPASDGDEDSVNRLVRWMAEYIGLAVRDKTKSVLFNWADRNPKIVGGLLDSRFDTIWQLMAGTPDLFYTGFHFYGPDKLTETLEAYLKTCERLGIVPLRVIGTEFGIDSTGGTQRGYKTWPDYKDTYAQWQVGQVKGDLAPFIQRGVLVGLTCFQEGNSGGWMDFDTENDTAYKAEIKRAALAGELEPVATKPLPPMYTVDPVTVGMKYKVSTPLDYINLRAAPLTAATEVAKVYSGNVVTVVGETLAAEGEYWREVTTADGKRGFFSMQGGHVKMTYTPDPEPVPVPTPAPQPTVSVYARLYDAQLKVAQAHFDLAQIYKELSLQETKAESAVTAAGSRAA